MGWMGGWAGWADGLDGLDGRMGWMVIRAFGEWVSALPLFPISSTITILWQLLHESRVLYLFYRYIRCFILILSIMIDDLRKLSIVEYR